MSHGYFSQRLGLHSVDWGNAGAPPLLLVHGGHCRKLGAQALRDDDHIIAHSLGGSISLQYAGHYRDNVVKLVAIEGLSRASMPRVAVFRYRRLAAVLNVRNGPQAGKN